MSAIAVSVVGVPELRPMLSHLDINWYLMISNSIEINRLVCVTEETSTKSRVIHQSHLNRIHFYSTLLTNIFYKLTIAKLKSETELTTQLRYICSFEITNNRNANAKIYRSD